MTSIFAFKLHNAVLKENMTACDAGIRKVMSSCQLVRPLILTKSPKGLTQIEMAKITKKSVGRQNMIS